MDFITELVISDPDIKYSISASYEDNIPTFPLLQFILPRVSYTNDSFFIEKILYNALVRYEENKEIAENSAITDLKTLAPEEDFLIIKALIDEARKKGFFEKEDSQCI